MKPGKDLKGVRLGRLTGVKRTGTTGKGRFTLAVWKFRCDCGKSVSRVGARVQVSIKLGRVPMCRACQSNYTAGITKLRNPNPYRWGTELDAVLQ